MAITSITEFSPRRQLALTGWEVVYATAGRIRLRVPQLAQDAEYARRLEHLLRSYDFVTGVSVNSRAMSVAVNYQASAITSDRVYSYLNV